MTESKERTLGTAGSIVKAGVAKPFSGIKVSQRTKESLLAYLYISPWLIGFLVFVAGCMVYSFGLMFFKSDLLTGNHFIGLENFRFFLKDELAGQALKVTAIYSFGRVPLITSLALLVALLLNQKIPAQGVYRVLYYLPSVVSGVAVAILWAWIFHPRFGLLNAGLAVFGIDGPKWLYSEEWALPALILMSVWGVGGNMLLYLAGLQGIPTPLYEAATIDVANAFHRFFAITLPMLTPTIFFNLVMNVINSFQVFSASFIMTQGGPNNATLTMVLYLYQRAFEQLRFGYASVLAWVLFTVILAGTVLVVRSSAAWVYYEGELK